MKLPLCLYYLLILTGLILPLTAISANANSSQSTDNYTVWFIDCGQGDSELIKTASGNYILIDANGHNPARFLQQHSVATLNALILSHAHADHYSGIKDILNANIHINSFIYTNPASKGATYQTLISKLTARGVTRSIRETGDTDTYDNLTFRYFNPSSTSKKENDNSLVIKISNQHGIDTLFTGDAETTSWTKTVNKFSADLDVEFLKAAHHGSRTGINRQEWKTFSPDATFISCGTGNKFGHPHKEALTIYQSKPVYRTDLNGTITLSVCGTQNSVIVSKPSSKKTATPK